MFIEKLANKRVSSFIFHMWGELNIFLCDLFIDLIWIIKFLSKRQATYHKFINHYSERPQVSIHRITISWNNLWSHITWCPSNSVCFVVYYLFATGEINQFQVSIFSHHNVFWFQISMYESSGVYLFQKIY